MVALVGKVVYYINLAFVVVVDFEYLVGFQEKISHIEINEIVAVFVCDTLVYMVQKYLVKNSHHHQMRDSSYNEVFAFYFYFVGKMDNFHYDPVEDAN